MKKGLGIALVLMLAVMLMPSAVFAGDPPTVCEIQWGDGTYSVGGVPIVVSGTGAGALGAIVTAGDDATAAMFTTGTKMNGTFKVTDSNNAADPDGYYNVDTVTSQISAYVEDGSITFQHDRNASLSRHGPAGQSSYSFVSVGGGWGELNKSGSCSDMAKLSDYHPGVGCDSIGGSYPPPQFNVNATSYTINRKMFSGSNAADDAWVELLAYGSGTAQAGAGYTYATGNGGAGYVDDYNMAKFTRLAAYTDDCAFSAVHSGGGTSHFEVVGGGTNSVTFPVVGLSDTGDGATETTLGITADFSGSFSIGDYSVIADSLPPSP